MNQLLRLVPGTQDSTLATNKLSLLISFELLTIPSPTTRIAISQLQHLRVYYTQNWLCVSIPLADRYTGSRDRRRTHKVSDLAPPPPRLLGRIEFASLRTGHSP